MGERVLLLYFICIGIQCFFLFCFKVIIAVIFLVILSENSELLLQ